MADLFVDDRPLTLAEIDREAGAMVMVPRLIDADQIATLMRVSKRHLMRLARDGKFPQPIWVGNRARWEASAYAKYVASLRDQQSKRKPTRGGVLATLLAAILAVGTVATAQADHVLPPLTIEEVRGFAAAGMAPMNADIEVLRKCPGLPMPSDMAPAEIARARGLGIDPGALWLRLHDAEIAKCLAGLSPEQRAID